MAAAEKLPPLDVLSLRRFQLPDLDRHRGWLIGRIKTAFPHLHEATMVGWLRATIYNNEFLFLFQNNSVALFQVVSAHSLSPAPAVEERFVFCEKPDDVDHQRQAAQFYVEAQRWAFHHGADAMVIEERTDVPHEMIAEVLPGRLLNRQQVFCKVRSR